MSSINDRTFAIGLGTAQQVSTSALNALTNSTGGYLLLSGILSPSIDDTFRLAKYFLQILAGVTNNNIVTDPVGFSRNESPHSVPAKRNRHRRHADPNDRPPGHSVSDRNAGRRCHGSGQQ